MSSEDYEMFRVMKSARKRLRERYAAPCEQCKRFLPKAHPTMLLPGAMCEMHGWTNPAPRLTELQVDSVFAEFGITRKTDHG